MDLPIRFFSTPSGARIGCGLSDRDRTDFSPAADVAVLEALVDHLELARFALVGVSASGPHTIAYAARHPQRVTHIKAQ